MTPDEVFVLRERLGLSQAEFGKALGIADASRTVRAWEEGVRNGKPFEPLGTAIAAMRYLEAILRVLEESGPDLEMSFPSVSTRLRNSLPDWLAGRMTPYEDG